MNPFDKVTLELNRKITSLEEENAALKEQVAQLEAENGNLLAANRDCIDHFDAAYKDLTSLQSKSAALVDALETYFKQYPHMMKGYIADALAAFKGEK